MGLGGRSPVEGVNFCWGGESCTVEARVQRAGLFMRLLNAPATSWEHEALLLQHSLRTDWYETALQDLRIIFPGVRILVGEGRDSTFMFSSAHWSDEGEWMGAQSPVIPQNSCGPRFWYKKDFFKTQMWTAVTRRIKRTQALLRQRFQQELTSTIL